MKLFDGINQESKDIILQGMSYAAAASPGGTLLPAVDTAAMVVIWGGMICSLGKLHNVQVGKEEWIKVATICGKSVLLYNIGGKVITWIVNCLCLGTTSVATMLVNAVLNVAATYCIGVAFDRMLQEESIEGKTIQEMARIGLRYMSPPGTGLLYEIVLWVRDWGLKAKPQQIAESDAIQPTKLIRGVAMMNKVVRVKDNCTAIASSGVSHDFREGCFYVYKDKGPYGLGTVRERGEGWAIALMLGVCITADARGENAMVSHKGLSVNINSLSPVVYLGGREIAVVVSYNDFGDGKLYCRRR